MSEYKKAIQSEYERAMSVPLDSVFIEGAEVVLFRPDTLEAGVKTSIGRCLLAHSLDTGHIDNRTEAVVVHGSGNTVRAVKAAAEEIKLDVRVIAVVYAETSKSTVANLRARGIEVVAEAPRRSGRVGRQSVVERICRRPDHVFLDQHEEPLIIQIQSQTFGKAIVDRLGLLATHFVAGVGTGGTLFGIGSALRRVNSRTQITAVEGVVSTLTLWHAYLRAKGKGYEKEKRSIEKALVLYRRAGMVTSLDCYPRRKDPDRWFEIDIDFPSEKKGVVGIDGLGVGNPTDLIVNHLRKVDRVRIITDQQATEGVRDLKSRGIFAVRSAGANFFASLCLAQELQSRGERGRILTVVTAGR